MALIQANMFSSCLMRTISIQGIIPTDKVGANGSLIRREKPLKTLYLLHGIFGNDTDWVSGTRIQRWAQDKNLAVIMPSGENHFYVDLPIPGNKYGEFIGQELPELTRTMFPLSKKRDDTFIAGLSMGGYGAMVNGLKYHQTFSHIAALSGAWILDNAINSTENTLIPFQKRSYYTSIFGNINTILGSDRDYCGLILKLKEARVQIPDIYLACGTEDPLLDNNRAYDAFLTKNKIRHTYEEGSGAHEWDFWDTYIHKVLDWLPLEDISESVSSGNVCLEDN